MSNIKYEAVVAELVHRVPEFEDAYKEHMTTYGELLPTVLLGGPLRQFLMDAYHASVKQKDNNTNDILRQISDFLEYCAESEDQATVGLIKVGFLETLNNAGPDTKSILKLFGPKTRALYEESEREWAEIIRHKRNSGREAGG
jgi:hypothetical protein